MEGAPHHNLQRRAGKGTQEGPSWEADTQMVSFVLALAASDFDIGTSASDFPGCHH